VYIQSFMADAASSRFSPSKKYIAVYLSS
jgi:hypothetical protein